jgi:hypothetical protein
MVRHIWCLIIVAFSCGYLGNAKVAEVADEASFLAALENGDEIIKVTQHLDLICQPNKKSGVEPDNVLCGPTDLNGQVIAKTTRAIVV